MADLAQHYRVTRAIGAAMIASLLIDAVVVEIIRARFAPFEGLLLPRPLAAALWDPLPALGPVAGVGAAIRAMTERPCPS
jgi:NAD/NADP transhydrogenase alpha subunit